MYIPHIYCGFKEHCPGHSNKIISFYSKANVPTCESPSRDISYSSHGLSASLWEVKYIQKKGKAALVSWQMES